MKKSLMLIAGLLVSSISVAQIKVVDDAFTPNLKEINFLEKPYDINERFVQYDGMGNSLKSVDYNAGRSRKYYNAQGETIYVLEPVKAFRINGWYTVEYRPLEKGGYYTCKYVMYTVEELSELCDNLSKYNGGNTIYDKLLKSWVSTYSDRTYSDRTIIGLKRVMVIIGLIMYIPNFMFLQIKTVMNTMYTNPI